MPEQSGWTVADESVNFDRSNSVMMHAYAKHDPNATIRSCGGFYWGILPTLFVGLTIRFAGLLAMHMSNRGKQTKKSLLFEMKRDRKFLAQGGFKRCENL